MQKLAGFLKTNAAQWGRTKPVSSALEDAEKKELHRILNWPEVIAVGLGEIIGAGIFVLTGVAAKTRAGPGVILSYVFAGVSCIFSALAYSEFASRVPISGSAYTYAYTVAGELIAWIIGWDLTLEYTLAAATVGRAWSGYIETFFSGLGVTIPKYLVSIPIGIFDLDISAAVIIFVISVILCLGVRESARFNVFLVCCTLSVITVTIIGGSFYTNVQNWDNFLPFGIPGIFSGASLVFFAYVGFDAVTTVAEEMKNPQRDLPIGVIGSLVLSLILYVAVACVITLMVPYDQIELTSPIASAFKIHGVRWIQVVISIGAFTALTTTILNSILSQSRIYYSMARDGLLWPWIARVHPRFKTPVNSTIVTGSFAMTLSFLLPIEDLAEMVSIGTLLAFTIVCACILSIRYSEIGEIRKLFITGIVFTAAITSISIVLQWPYALSGLFGAITLGTSAPFFFYKKSDNIEGIKFVCPLVPLVPLLGLYSNIYMMMNLGADTWIRLLIWLLIGFVIYFGYSRNHSKFKNVSNDFNVTLPKSFEKIPDQKLSNDDVLESSPGSVPLEPLELDPN